MKEHLKHLLIALAVGSCMATGVSARALLDDVPPNKAERRAAQTREIENLSRQLEELTQSKGLCVSCGVFFSLPTRSDSVQDSNPKTKE